MRPALFVLLGVSALACGNPATPSANAPAVAPNGDLLANLRRVIPEVVNSDDIDQQHSRITTRVIESRILIGKTRQEIESALGAASVCGQSWTCPIATLDSNDLYYEVGRLPQGHAGGVPMLFLDFDANGICTNTHFLHGQ